MMHKYGTHWSSGLPETPCGRGSKLENTELIRQVIREVIADYDVQSLADVGCGDQNWIFESLPAWIEYSGFDVRPRAEGVVRFDCTQEVLPRTFDLVLCIYVLNHIYIDAGIERAVTNFKASGSRYLLATFSTTAPIPLPLKAWWHHKIKNGVDWSYGLFSLCEKRVDSTQEPA